MISSVRGMGHLICVLHCIYNTFLSVRVKCVTTQSRKMCARVSKVEKLCPRTSFGLYFVRILYC